MTPPAPARLRVAITGGIGSGKSTVADRFAALGAGLVDSDAIAHALTRRDGEAIAPIRAAFGDDVIAADGALDRRAMRALAFDRPEARARLEAILHPMIRARSASLAGSLAASHPYLLFVIPLLAEGGDAHARFDRVLVVDCAPEVQLARVMARSGLAEAEVRAIMAVQASRESRLAIADDVIDNSGDLAALEAPVARLHERYLELAQAGGAGPV